MPHHRAHHISLVDRFLEGRVGFDQLEAELLAAAARVDRGGIDMRASLGLSPGELAAVSRSPASLRYILHARRFTVPVQQILRSDLNLAQSEVDAAVRSCDPLDVAALHEAHMGALQESHTAPHERSAASADAHQTDAVMADA